MKTRVYYATVLTLLGAAIPVVGQDQEALAKSAQDPIANRMKGSAGHAAPAKVNEILNPLEHLFGSFVGEG